MQIFIQNKINMYNQKSKNIGNEQQPSKSQAFHRSINLLVSAFNLSAGPGNLSAPRSKASAVVSKQVGKQTDACNSCFVRDSYAIFLTICFRRKACCGLLHHTPFPKQHSSLSRVAKFMAVELFLS